MAKKATAPAEALRRCVGSKTFGIEAHDEPISNFPAQPSRKDGLGVMCKPHWSQYVKALRDRAKATKSSFDARDAGAADITITPEVAGSSPDGADGSDDLTEAAAKPRRSKPKVVDATETQKAEIAALEAAVKAAGGAGTDEGQALLEAAAERSAAKRTRRTKDEMPVETPLGEQIDSGTEEADAA